MEIECTISKDLDATNLANGTDTLEGANAEIGVSIGNVTKAFVNVVMNFWKWLIVGTHFRTLINLRRPLIDRNT